MINADNYIEITNGKVPAPKPRRWRWNWRKAAVNLVYLLGSIAILVTLGLAFSWVLGGA